MCTSKVVINGDLDVTATAVDIILLLQNVHPEYILLTAALSAQWLVHIPNGVQPSLVPKPLPKSGRGLSTYCVRIRVNFPIFREFTDTSVSFDVTTVYNPVLGF